MELIIYLLKVNVAIILFYGLYRWLFERDTFFQWKRFALLSFVFISFTYPVIDISRQWFTHPDWKEILETALLPSYTLPEVHVAGEATLAWRNPIQLFIGVYLCVVCLLLVRMLVQIGTIIYKVRNTHRTVLQGQTVYESSGLKTPFSFFRWIILDSVQYSETELQEILLHETAHVEYRHSIDTILAELVCMFCWFNPFAWLLKKEIRINLEFLADRSVVTAGCETEHYQFHLLRLSYHKAAAQLFNNFNVSPLKKRIFMMNKKQTSNRSILKYALIFPVIALLLFFNCSFQIQARSDNSLVANSPVDPPPAERSKEVLPYAEVMPQFPGGENALMSWLADNIRYPEEAVQKKLEGRVVVRYVVEVDGSINDVEIKHSLDPILDQEAIRVVKSMPTWTPGSQSGNPVAVYYTLPIAFKLQNVKQDQSKVQVKQDQPKIQSNVPEETVYEIDGKIVSKGDFNRMNPNNIDAVSVFKDKQPNRISITTKK